MASLWESAPLKTPQDLTQFLLSHQVITPDQVRVASLEARHKKQTLEASLVTLGFISESALAVARAESTGTEHLDLTNVVLDSDLLQTFTKNQVQQYQILPLSLEDGVLRLGMVDTYGIQALDFVRRLYPSVEDIHPVVISYTQFLEAVDRYYGYEMSINALLSEIELGTRDDESIADYQNPTVRLVDAIILDGVKQSASDIHFEPEGAYMRIRYRLDGILHQIRTLHSSNWPSMCVRLKVLAGMNIAESRKPQSGRFSMGVGLREVDFRASSHPTVHGENIVLRILDKVHSLMTMDQLGYSETAIGNIHDALSKPEGLIIVTGPTGSGKTTSLYSMLQTINGLDVNIMTLEEPVEYVLPLVRQTQVRETLSFVEGVKSILRQDPDVILIGEIRDEDTAQMALRAAMTGHKVFTTLHTQDALSVLHRLDDFGIRPSLVAENLTAIIAQRLVRRLCNDCKSEHSTTERETSLLECAQSQVIYKPNGCNQCHHTGYRGRTALGEVLLFDPTLEEMLQKNHSHSTIMKTLRKKGYATLEEDALYRVLSGETSLSEIHRCLNLEGGT